MPGMDGTGPLGQGTGTGRGLGPCGSLRSQQSGNGINRYCPSWNCGRGRAFRGGRRGFGRGMNNWNFFSRPTNQKDNQE
jgi:hypothetical protein